jgi:hypothetical protein
MFVLSLLSYKSKYLERLAFPQTAIFDVPQRFDQSLQRESSCPFFSFWPLKSENMSHVVLFFSASKHEISQNMSVPPLTQYEHIYHRRRLAFLYTAIFDIP